MVVTNDLSDAKHSHPRYESGPQGHLQLSSRVPSWRELAMNLTSTMWDISPSDLTWDKLVNVGRSADSD